MNEGQTSENEGISQLAFRRYDDWQMDEELLPHTFLFAVKIIALQKYASCF